MYLPFMPGFPHVNAMCAALSSSPWHPGSLHHGLLCALGNHLCRFCWTANLPNLDLCNTLRNPCGTCDPQTAFDVVDMSSLRPPPTVCHLLIFSVFCIACCLYFLVPALTPSYPETGFSPSKVTHALLGVPILPPMTSAFYGSSHAFFASASAFSLPITPVCALTS